MQHHLKLKLAHTHGRERVYIDKFIQMFACVSYLLNQYFKLSNSRNLNDAKHPRDLLNTITSRFAQHNHLAICSTQSPRDLLNTITSRFAQHSHLLVSAHDKALDTHTTAVIAWPLQCTRYVRQLQKNIPFSAYI